MPETLQQFTERLSKAESKAEYVIGRACYGNTRSIFEFDGMVCHLESFGYRCPEPRSKLHSLAKAIWMTAVEPRESWVTDYMIYGKVMAEAVAKYYEATLSEAPYAAESGVWFSLVFDTFEKLCRFLYERKTGAFDKQWQIRNPEYQNCA
jgi:hypothetical protein